jgi:aspartyl protease family protein
MKSYLFLLTWFASFGSYLGEGVAQTISIPYYENSGVLEVDVKIFDINRRFIFDTGASSISLSAELYDLLRNQGRIDNRHVIGYTKCRIADGSLVDGLVFLLESISVGGHTFNNVEATVIFAQNVPLLLGQSFLGQFGKVSVDYNSRVIELQRSNRAAVPYGVDEVRFVPCDRFNIANVDVLRRVFESGDVRISRYSQEQDVPPPFNAVSKLRTGITIRYFDNNDYRNAEKLMLLIRKSNLVFTHVPIQTENMLPFFNYKPISGRIEVWMK